MLLGIAKPRRCGARVMCRSVLHHPICLHVATTFQYCISLCLCESGISYSYLDVSSWPTCWVFTGGPTAHWNWYCLHLPVSLYCQSLRQSQLAVCFTSVDLFQNINWSYRNGECLNGTYYWWNLFVRFREGFFFFRNFKQNQNFS